MKVRVFSGFFLSAVSYPFIAFLIPRLIDPFTCYGAYLFVAETFAPASECLVFWLLFGRKNNPGWEVVLQDSGVIVAANLFSFGAGEILKYFHLIPVIVG